MSGCGASIGIAALGGAPGSGVLHQLPSHQRPHDPGTSSSGVHFHHPHQARGVAGKATGMHGTEGQITATGGKGYQPHHAKADSVYTSGAGHYVPYVDERAVR
ncbi:unnamed protein product, partial [Amoebophrya sp. A25]|eukprot:GSA25T00015148001.1